MAKRFTATEKWIDPWFTGLAPIDKLFWIFLLDNCDHAGIWQVNWPLVQFHIKDYVFNEQVFNGRIKQLNPEKWFIPKFIVFQYGELNPENRAHLSVICILKKEGAYKGLITTFQGRKDMVKDMDKDKVVLGVVKGFDDIWSNYPNKVGKKAAQAHFTASIKTEKDFEDIKIALENYLKSERVSKGYIQNASTWFNNWQDWITPPMVGQEKSEFKKRWMKEQK